MASTRPPSLRIVSQVYVPDPASVGQHLHDVARYMVGRGHEVEVLTSARGYDDPAVRYPAREVRDGVSIERLPLSSFGKGSIATRLLGSAVFLGQAATRLSRGAAADAVLLSTSPPIAPALGLLLARLSASRLIYWVMDLNPDQLVALGQISSRSPLVAIFDAVNRPLLRSADEVVALDGFMKQRLLDKAGAREIQIVPPWPHTPARTEPAPIEFNAVRDRHGWGDRFVVMYSGNLSPCHPVDTLLRAARELRDDARFVFVFVGGGARRQEVEDFRREHSLDNLVLLPYAPLAQVEDSLSAANLHVVSMGDAMVGIVHPCKIYGALAVGRPVLLLGPARSHVGEIVEQHRVGWRVEHGDVAGAVAALREAAQGGEAALRAMGQRGVEAIGERFAHDRLCGALADLIEGRESFNAPGTLPEAARSAAGRH